MIINGGTRSYSTIQKRAFQLFIYGLGFESRSTKIASLLQPDTKIFALKMPEIRIHAYDRNVRFANTRGHAVISDFKDFIDSVLPTWFERRRSGHVKIGFDISSLNRLMLVEILIQLARLCREGDEIEVYYCPAAYEEPNWQFPQIEKLGPINPAFSCFNSDPTRPLCLVFGAGFEAGFSVGIISQLEPMLSYCLWGTGVDRRYDRAVRRANFDFQFTGFNTKTISYDIKDPKGAFSQIESIVYGLTRDYRIIIIPMGPKLFTFLAALIGMTYFGDVAVWRVQHSRISPPDSIPGTFCIGTALDISLMKEFSALAESANTEARTTLALGTSDLA
jgi:hypothetical protein